MLVNRIQVANPMNPFLTLFPTAAAFALFLCSFPAEDFRPGKLLSQPAAHVDHAVQQSIKQLPSQPTQFERTSVATRIAQLETGATVIPGGFSSVPLVPNVAQAIQITSPRMRVAFQDTTKVDLSIPAPKTADSADVKKDEGNDKKTSADKKEKSVERKHGRIRLLKGIVYSSYRPAKKQEKESAKAEAKKKAGSDVPAPRTSPKSDTVPAAATAGDPADAPATTP